MIDRGGGVKVEHEHIGQMLGCAIGTSKSQLHKARMKLRRLLNERITPQHTPHNSRAPRPLGVQPQAGKGREKTQQKYINAGLPIDVEHFFRVAALAQDYPDWAVRKAYTHEEFKQAKDTRPAGRTSAFAPEDLFSNELGLIFGTTVGEAADSANADFASELNSYLREIRTLFTTNELKDGKFLTEERIQDLREIAKTYYGTDDLRQFLKSSKVFNLNEIKKINENAAVENYPFYNNPVSAGEYQANRKKAEVERRNERPLGHNL